MLPVYVHAQLHIHKYLSILFLTWNSRYASEPAGLNDLGAVGPPDFNTSTDISHKVSELKKF